jgi:hypothetical protein
MSRFRSHRVPSSSGHPAPARSHLLHSCRPSQSTRERSFFWSRPRGGRIAGGKGLLIGFLKFVIVISEGLVGLPGRVVVRHPNAPLSMFPQCCANVFGVPPELFAPGPSPKTGAKRIRSHRWLRSKALRCASARPGSRSRHLGMRVGTFPLRTRFERARRNLEPSRLRGAVQSASRTPDGHGGVRTSEFRFWPVPAKGHSADI